MHAQLKIYTTESLHNFGTYLLLFQSQPSYRNVRVLLNIDNLFMRENNKHKDWMFKLGRWCDIYHKVN